MLVQYEKEKALCTGKLRIAGSRKMRARQAIFATTGGPEVIEWQSVDLSPPGPGEVTLRQTAVGVNFIDTYHRRGIYPVNLPRPC